MTDAEGLTPVSGSGDNPLMRIGPMIIYLGTNDFMSHQMGAPAGRGISFPTNNQNRDYFLRTGFMPKRLFNIRGMKQAKVQNDMGVTLTNTGLRTHKGWDLLIIQEQAKLED